MRILDVYGRDVVQPDYSKGKTVPDKIFIKLHEAQPAVEERFHYEVLADYPNGGKDLVKIIDQEAVPAKEAWNEFEDILRYIEFSPEELEAIEAEKNKPSKLDELEAQILYTAMMTDTLMEVENV